MTNVTPYYPRHFMARMVFCWLFLILLYFFFTGTLLSQMAGPPLVAPGSDNSFWLLNGLHLPQWLLQHHWASLGFDILLTTACLICIFLPQQRLFTWITVLGVWLLYVCYCSAAGKHYAQIGYLITPVAFLALRPDKFDLSWQLVRYWVCFLYGSAGLYKLWYGGFFGADTMANIVAQTNADWLVLHPDGWQRSIITGLMENPVPAQWLYRLATVADLALLIGFFTKKWDKWLVLSLLLFHVGNFFILHISFAEQSLIFAPFLPWQRWANFFQSIKGND